MRAVWVSEFGPPGVLVERETPDPAPAEGEVVVDVAAASVTFVETAVRGGRAPWPAGGPTPPYVPGNGVAGTVSLVGAGVDPAWIGRRVATTTGGTGGYAERAVAKVNALVAVPPELDLEEAAALLADGRTATGLALLAAPRPHESVLVLAAAGGVGTLLVQLCAAAGARVTGAAGAAAKHEVVRSLGAEAIDYAEIADRPPVDLAFDGVGGRAGADSLRALRPGGRFVMYGLASGAPTPIDRDDVTVVGWAELGSLGARSAELTATAFAEAAAGRLRPVIGQTFPLARAADAHAAIESRRSIGKTLLVP